MSLVASPGPDKIFTGNFVLLWIANFTNFGSFYLLLTTLPLYLVEVGLGESDIGLLIGVLSVTAVVFRPFTGRVADVWSRKWVAVAGGLIIVISFVMYPLATSMPLLLALHVFRGAGWGAFLAAAPALVADIAPERRRGEMVGYYGTSTNVAMVISPYAGVVILKAFGFTALFLSAAAMALGTFLCPTLISEPARGVTADPVPRRRFQFIETVAMFPMLILCLYATSYGALVVYLPLYSPGRGMDNPGLFFIPFALVAMSTRGLAGRASDRFGRSATIVPGMLLAAAALVIHAQANSLSMFITVAVVYGLAFSLIHPALMALLIDRVRPEARGVTMATFTAGFDLGIGIGSFVAGWMLEIMNFPAMYRWMAVVPLMGMVIFVLGRRLYWREGPGD